MTAVDVVVIVGGLLFGYRLVSNYLSPHVDDGQRSADDQAQRQDKQTNRWQQHWQTLSPPEPPWFDVLGVSEQADLPEIERAYRSKISQYHPDKVAQLGEDIRSLAEAKSKQINAAYEQAVALRRRARL